MVNPCEMCTHSGEHACKECEHNRYKKGAGGLRWTTDKPTEPGWYYWRSRPVKDSFYWFAYYFDSDTFWAGGTGVIEPNGGEWSGPIPEPEEE
jgi:hypothetical protein